MQTPGPRPTGFANSLDPSSQFESERHRMALLCPGWKQRVDFEQESYQGESWCFNIFQCIYSIYILYRLQIFIAPTDPAMYWTVLLGKCGSCWEIPGHFVRPASGSFICFCYIGGLIQAMYATSPNDAKFDPFWSILIHSFHLLLILWVNMTTFENSPNHHGPEPLVILGNDYARSLGHTNSSAGEGQIGAYQTRMCTKTLG